MINNLRKYWFEFEISSAFDVPVGIGMGCGITALNYQDAISIMDEKMFFKINRPAFVK